LIGEAPGETEDLTGQAFVGKAGQLLDKIFAAIGIDTNKDTLILNMVKCRPPNNRIPTLEEITSCSQYLAWQLKNVQPNIIVLVGATAAKAFLNKPNLKITQWVGRPFGIKEYPTATLMILFHPAYLLRNPAMKIPTWEHVKLLKEILPT
jgi:DNA polymerase